MSKMMIKMVRYVALVAVVAAAASGRPAARSNGGGSANQIADAGRHAAVGTDEAAAPDAALTAVWAQKAADYTA